MTNRVSAFLRRVGALGDNPTAADSSGSTIVAEFGIPNMVCEGCAESIDGILRGVPGVRDVQPDLAKKKIQVRYELGRVDHHQIKNCLMAAGFTPADA